MPTADYPQTNYQTERINRVIGDFLRSVCAESPNTWSSMHPVIEFVLNNAVYASTGFNPFYVNRFTLPRVPHPLHLCGYGLGGELSAEKLAGISPTRMQKRLSRFLATFFNILQYLRDAMADNQDKQKEQADYIGRRFIDSYEVGN